MNALTLPNIAPLDAAEGIEQDWVGKPAAFAESKEEQRDVGAQA